jgi:hypothetical protein
MSDMQSVHTTSLHTLPSSIRCYGLPDVLHQCVHYFCLCIETEAYALCSLCICLADMFLQQLQTHTHSNMPSCCAQQYHD